MRTINQIIIHCSATAEGRAFTVEDIRRWHLARGWRDVGYHFVILLDGTVEAGRPVSEEGAHCAGHNKTSIGICYIGGCASDGKTAKDTRTPAQKAAMLTLVRQLMHDYHISAERVYGHREFARKACPSFDVREWKGGLL